MSPWKKMEDAPRDGTHVILAVKRGPFVYAVQGAFYSGEWSNAADIDSAPLCWMPNVKIPDEFLPWKNAQAANHAEDDRELDYVRHGLREEDLP